MSPKRSKATVRPSGLTSRFIQVPSVTSILTGWVSIGGDATSHFFSSFSAASAVVESRKRESAAMPLTMKISSRTRQDGADAGEIGRQYGAISRRAAQAAVSRKIEGRAVVQPSCGSRSEEHTSELQ